MPCDRCTARVHAPLFQIFNHAAMGIERLVQKILRTARQKLCNQVTNDIGQGIGHNAHERVAAKIDDRVVEGFVLFRAARALQLFLNAPQTLYLFGVLVWMAMR